MNRRQFLAGLVAVPFLGRVVRSIAERAAPAPALYLDMAAATAILKEFYSGQRVADMIHRDNTLLRMLDHDHVSGDGAHPCPVCIARRCASTKSRLLESRGAA